VLLRVIFEEQKVKQLLPPKYNYLTNMARLSIYLGEFRRDKQSGISLIYQEVIPLNIYQTGWVYLLMQLRK